MWYLPFINFENAHSKCSHQPTGKGDNDNAHNNRHMVSRDFGNNLASNDAVHHTISQNCEDVEQATDLTRIIPHKVPCDDL